MATVAIVGAGLAGLACGKALQASGNTVVWLEKSRGVGGRFATRRLSDSWVDHGVRYWAPSGLQALTQQLLSDGILHPWSAQGFVWQGELKPSSRVVYCAEQGVNAIAKYLAQGCDIRRQHRVTALTKTESGWQLTAHSPEGTVQIETDMVVLAIPAPQVMPLLEPLDTLATHHLQSVEYDACLSLMLTYDALPETRPLNHLEGWYVLAEDAVLSWLSLDSSKPSANRSSTSTGLLQTQPGFATQYLQQLDSLPPHTSAAETLLQKTIAAMLTAAATIVPGLQQPQSSRLHRWRYSTVKQPYPKAMLTTHWPSLLGCGDWCCPDELTGLAAAYASGLAAAASLKC